VALRTRVAAGLLFSENTYSAKTDIQLKTENKSERIITTGKP